MKYKKGDRVRITDRIDGHKFEIGEVVTITAVRTSYYRATNGKDLWSICDRECEFVEYPGLPKNKKKEAYKLDEGKNRLDLLPIYPLEEVGRVLTFGAKKYAPSAWRAGMDWSRLYGAAFRHLFAWWRGEENDKETGLSHLAHALCCIMFLLEYTKTKKGTDDRHKEEV